MGQSPGDITQLLRRIAEGDRNAEQHLFPVVYDELRRLAGYLLRGERPEHTLQATALVNEAYLRLTGQTAVSCQDRSHFFAVAAKVMRRILVDHARGANASKRRGTRVALDSVLVYSEDQSAEIIAIDEALNDLAVWDARQSRIVELRFFVGVTEGEIAEVLGVSVRTVKRDWVMARAWLHGELEKH